MPTIPTDKTKMGKIRCKAARLRRAWAVDEVARATLRKDGVPGMGASYPSSLSPAKLLM